MNTKDIFYFEQEQLLCWVAGYTNDGNTSSVALKIKALTENATKFAELANVPISDVNTYYVTSSRRYKYMRVFYAKVAKKNIPTNTFCFTNQTMFQYLTD
jgi:hypothetical protein